jgi:chaperonin GroES
MKLKPTEDRIILKPVPPDTKTKSGLIIPNEAQKIQMWEVVDVGPSQGPIKLEAGMIVTIPESAGYDYELDGQQFRVIRHGSVDLYDTRK